MYNSTMMGFIINKPLTAMEMSYDNRLLMIGNKKEGIKVTEIKRNNEYWFQQKTSITKHKNQNHFMVSDLGWNQTSEGYERFAVSTFNKFLFVYSSIQNTKTYNYLQCFKDNYINKLQWEPKSKDIIYAASQGNSYIAVWDTRTPTKECIPVNQESNDSQIKDFKFNQQNQNDFALLFDDNSFSIFDRRNLQKQKCKYDDSQNLSLLSLPGNNYFKMRWDPNRPDQIAIANQQQIKIWNISGDKPQEKTSLNVDLRISDFWWKKCSEYMFTVSLSPEESDKLVEHNELLQYDLSAEKDQQLHSYYMSDLYDFKLGQWIYDRNEELLISCSKLNNRQWTKKQYKEKYVVLAQEAKNAFKIEEDRYYRPLMFDCENLLVTNIKVTDKKKKTNSYYPISFEQREKSLIKVNKSKLNKIQQKMKKNKNTFDKLYSPNELSNLKNQIKFLYQYYLRKGSIESIIERNKQVAQCLSSKSKQSFCAPIWDILFAFGFPKNQQYHTLDSLFEDKVNVELMIEDVKVYISDRQKLARMPPPTQIQEKIQFLANQNQLFTAVIAAIIMRDKDQSLVSDQLLIKLVYPLIELLRRFQMYGLAAQISKMTKLQYFMSQFMNRIQNTNEFKLYCGRCRRNYNGACLCNQKCILCPRPLKQGYLMWCKICGHAGHARQYEEWFKTHDSCPYGCTHKCFIVSE